MNNNNNIPSSVYLLQFEDGDYLSWYEISTHFSFGRTSTMTQAAIFEDITDVPEWINNYLGGKIIHISLEVVDEG